MPIPTPSVSYRQRQNVDSPDAEASTQQQGNNEQVVKRRSLLPQPGQGIHVSRLPETASTTKISQKQALGRPRPRSMYVTTLATNQEPAEEQPASPSSTRLPGSIVKPSEKPAAGLSRSRSLRKPITTQTAPSTGQVAHSRTQSTSNLPSQRTVPSSFRSNNTTAAPSSTAPKAPTRVAGLSRIGSVSRKQTTSQAMPSTRATSRPEQTVATQSRRRENTRDESTLGPRPAFTTLQQHFTPRKVGKAPTSTFLQPVAMTDSKILPPEIITLQSELLQLHLLHGGSMQVEHEWQVSSKLRLHMKFDEVVSYHRTMLEQEREGQEQKNLKALFQWSKDKQHADLAQSLQVLSGPLHELPSLIGVDGRFQRVVCEFKQWMRRAEDVWSARSQSKQEQGDLIFVGDLGEFWQAEAASMDRKLTAFARDMDQLPLPSQGSSVACIVDTCNALLRGTLDELHAMQRIVTDVVAGEKEWVENQLQKITQDIVMDDADTSGETAAWKM